MAKVFLDTLGMKCPQAISEIVVKALHMKSGDILEVLGDGSCFENDIRTLCKRIRKDFVSLKHENHHGKKFQIRIDETIGTSIIYRIISDNSNNNIEYFNYLKSSNGNASSLNTIYDFILKCNRNEIDAVLVFS